MKRSRFPRRAKQTPDLELLVRLSTELAGSTSRIEDTFWADRLAKQVHRLLLEKDERTISDALDQLYAGTDQAYDALIDLVESCAETRSTDTGSGHDVILIALPILAWSRFQIPSGPIHADHLASIRVQFQAHLLASDARLGLADFLFSPDQLPQSYVDTTALTEKLARAALHSRDLKIDIAQMAETVSFLSDTRYLVAAVAGVRGAPLFRWQEGDLGRELAVKRWHEQGSEVLRPLLPACAMDLLPPMAYHSALREADRASRPYSLVSAISFLQTVMGRPAADFRAVVGGYHDKQLEEFRIGFCLRGRTEVIHGVVWPLLESEDEGTEAPSLIEAVLRANGVIDVLVLDQRLPIEYCDDCGAPLYPSPDGETVHAEMPDEPSDATPRHLH
ncbi:MAG: DUF2863 family protein [Rhodocyclaceae bacterium]|nr:DUF2863 family protein [Rhodocyclaceae bacterium]MBK9623451.1 DUF2863 family protein [Rhodocyclaceae bacterium]MBL0076055.1 DUF2863 family protein [Rhodocyclaceae bacterium]MBP6108366.1 DUF2863 family protein [Rhodocyclaceae bacterium]MBP6278382.1 DUF2863 family protein [Rhodocyclaceae bacterium]